MDPESHGYKLLKVKVRQMHAMRLPRNFICAPVVTCVSSWMIPTLQGSFGAMNSMSMVLSTLQNGDMILVMGAMLVFVTGEMENRHG